MREIPDDWTSVAVPHGYQPMYNRNDGTARAMLCRDGMWCAGAPCGEHGVNPAAGTGHGAPGMFYSRTAAEAIAALERYERCEEAMGLPAGPCRHCNVPFVMGSCPMLSCPDWIIRMPSGKP